MLDTDTASYFMKRSHPQVIARFGGLASSSVCISVISKCELLFGVEISPRQEKDRKALGDLLSSVAVLSYSEDAAAHYALIRAYLKNKGTPIGPNDLLIAAHARSLGLTLVSNNTREFSRVDGLLLETWAEPTTE